MCDENVEVNVCNTVIRPSHLSYIVQKQTETPLNHQHDFEAVILR